MYEEAIHKRAIHEPAPRAASSRSRELAETLADRRSFLAIGGLSAATIAMLAGCGRLLASEKPTEASLQADIEILGSAIAAEHEAVAAYQLGADSGLLEPAVGKLALQFQSHHRTHADVLAGTLRRLGGVAPDPAPDYGFPVESLSSQADVLAFAADLEKGAVSAYLEAVAKFGDRELARAAASILGDEAMHWAVLRQALGQDPVPVAFVS